MPSTTEPWVFQGEVRIASGNLKPARPRSEMEQRPLVSDLINPTDWRVHDAFHTVLPGTPASDDLGLVGGSFGTATPTLQTHDVKALGTSIIFARTQKQPRPEYDDGQTVMLRFRTGMLTTPAGTSAQIDVEAYKVSKEAGVTGSDLVQTSAQSINSLTLADKDFELDASGLVNGDTIDIRIKVAIVDASTVTAVKGIVGHSELLYDSRG